VTADGTEGHGAEECLMDMGHGDEGTWDQDVGTGWVTADGAEGHGMWG